MSPGKSQALPSALEGLREMAEELRSRKAAVFLDYDGTLTPIVERPELALLSEETRRVLEGLTRVCPVAVISGRSRERVQGLVGLEGVVYAGSHGLDISASHVPGLRNDVGRGYREAIDAALADLSPEMEGVEGVILEHTNYTAAVHYRLVAPEEVPQVEAAVDRVLGRHTSLRKTHGKKVFELRPRMDWDKGKAVLWVLGALGLDSPDVLPIYLGDDITDEDAFRALEGRGLGVLVAEAPRETAAGYMLKDPTEVREFLERLTSLLAEGVG